jgi:two-component system sensor histidine kinase DesK
MLNIRRVAQDSIREMREVVGGLRTTDLDSELAGARGILRSAGISVRVIGEGANLPRNVQVALGWVVREATTNIIRHSDATTVRIEVDVTHHAGLSPQAELRLENDGVRAADPSRAGGTGTGSGLVGLAERLAALGGNLTAEPSAHDGFLVQARLPLTQESPVVATPIESAP